MNAVLKQSEKDIMQVHEEFVRLENEAVGNPDHPVNEGLNTYFEEVKRKLERLRNADQQV